MNKILTKPRVTDKDYDVEESADTTIGDFRASVRQKHQLAGGVTIYHDGDEITGTSLTLGQALKDGTTIRVVNKRGVNASGGQAIEAEALGEEGDVYVGDYVIEGGSYDKERRELVGGKIRGQDARGDSGRGGGAVGGGASYKFAEGERGEKIRVVGGKGAGGEFNGTV